MEKQAVLDLYREQYSLEIGRKDAITSQCQTRFAIIVTEVSLLIYMFKTFALEANGYVLAGFVATGVITVILVCKAGVLLSSAYTGNEYSYLPLVSEIDAYRKELESVESAGSQFIDHLLEEYSACSGSNAKLNDKRLSLLNRSLNYIRYSAIAFALTGALFIGADLDSSSPRKPLEVEFDSCSLCLKSNTSTEVKDERP
ncbi:hypothetical protein GZ77_19070 [Endozoicomonas montiporae]|uniref:Uncharacterized protein n=2 Tax=Endozoicomonas montiporae TaxID=1027273 RepID=A0A081N2D3_9GAMM|nr:hypothetical protein [Endozoicomonas montiporae]AMO58431.1 hypothetical protein EZMO1_4518 [Endozoicomonas montiporae CL-33]KEQ12606.1 hypothetical protein GZ77_19070 [Endozoicomonas montiporae]